VGQTGTKNPRSLREVLKSDALLQKLNSCEEKEVAVNYTDGDRLTIQEGFGIIELSKIQCGR